MCAVVQSLAAFSPFFVISRITQVATPSSLHLTFPPTTLLSLCERSYEKSRLCGQPLQLTVAAALAKVASHRSDAQQERAPAPAAAGFSLAGSSPSVAPLRRRREPARSLDVAERLRARYTHVALGRVDEEGRQRVRRAAEVRVRVVAGDGGRVLRVGGGVAPLAPLLQSRVTAGYSRGSAEVQPRPRFSRSSAEVQPRYSRGSAEVQPRATEVDARLRAQRRGTAELQPSYSPSLAQGPATPSATSRRHLCRAPRA